MRFSFAVALVALLGALVRLVLFVRRGWPQRPPALPDLPGHREHTLQLTPRGVERRLG